MRSSPEARSGSGEPGYGALWALSMEMGGQMSAVFFNAKSDAWEAADRFCRDHGLADYYDTHARCSVALMSVRERKTALVDGLDARFALIEMVSSTLELSIHETKEDLEEAIERLADSAPLGEDPFYSWHVILMPQFEVDDATA
jgi:hypothetical protein